MKTLTKLVAIGFLAVGISESRAEPRNDRMMRREPPKKEFVEWTGTVSDSDSSHTTEHEHELTFTRKDNGESYDIVDSPELVQLHHEKDKNLVIEMRAEKTPRFLFWGGNLIVKSFKVVEELEQRPHLDPPKRVVSSARRFHEHEHGQR
jgi:hypothetical protein